MMPSKKTQQTVEAWDDSTMEACRTGAACTNQASRSGADTGRSNATANM